MKGFKDSSSDLATFSFAKGSVFYSLCSTVLITHSYAPDHGYEVVGGSPNVYSIEQLSCLGLSSPLFPLADRLQKDFKDIILEVCFTYKLMFNIGSSSLTDCTESPLLPTESVVVVFALKLPSIYNMKSTETIMM